MVNKNNRNIAEERFINKLEVRQYASNLLRFYFRTDQENFDIHSIALQVESKFKSRAAYNIACDLYAEKIGI